MGRQHALLGVLLLTGFLLAPVQSSIMAVDLGSENLKVSLIKPGRTPISIVVNEMSKRKTPALVGFANAERLLGEEAASFAVRYPDTTILRARDLLAKPHDDPTISAMLKEHNLPYSVVSHPVRKQAAIKLKDGTHVSAEELVASIIHYARQIAEAQSGAPVLDAVIAVPAYFGQAQRQALIDSAALVGVNVMGLINTHTAAALQFGIERDFTNKTQNVIFYDMGSGGTVVSLVRYSSYVAKDAGPGKAISQLEVRDVDWDADLGANSLDTLLAEHFTKLFADKHKIPVNSVLSNPRSMAKMKKQVRRTKEMLSANTGAPISVEEFHDGRDFQASITRDEFEKLAGTFFERAAAPLKRILDRSGLNVSDLEYVELLGGGTRVPRLQTVLSEVLGGRTLDRHVDADEAVVMGASLFAANLSTSFRLRKFGMTDVSMYGVSLREDEAHTPPVQPAAAGDSKQDTEGGSQDRNLLPYLKRLPVRRVVHWTNLTQDPLRVSLRYNESAPHPLPPGVSTPELASFTITGIDTAVKRYNQSGTVNVKFEASYDGILRLTKAEALIEYYVMEEKRVLIKTNTTANATEPSSPSDDKDKDSQSGDTDSTKSDGSKTEDTEDTPNEGAEAADSEDTEAPTPTPAPEGTDTNSTTKAGEGAAGNDTAPAAPKYETITVPKRKVAKVALSVSARWSTPPLEGEAQQASQTLLSKWVAAEEAKRQTAAAKNDLEAYIIRMREAVESSERILKVTTAAQREPFMSALAAAEDWLYMEGEGEAVTAFRDKLAELRKTGDVIEIRAQEAEDRPLVVSRARKEATLKQSAVGLWATDRPWISEEERKELETKITDFLAWLDAKLALQANKEPHEDPAFTSKEVAVEYEKLERAFNKLANKKKPKPPPEPPAPANTTENATSTEPGSGDGSAPNDTTDGKTEAPGTDKKDTAPPTEDPKTKKATDDKAKKAADDKAKKEAADKAKKEAADKAKREAAEKAKKAKEDKAKKDKAAKDKKAGKGSKKGSKGQDKKGGSDEL